MPHALAARIVAGLAAAARRCARRVGRDERGQGTVEYAGLAMAIGVLLVAIGSYLSGKDHGIGSVVTGALKDAIEQASARGR